MIVSNALPVQLWDKNQQTYNEKEVCGIEPVCWCQPVQCTDEIIVQATAEGSEDIEDYNPALLDEDGIMAYDAGAFDASGTETIVPSDHDICDGKYQLVIYDPALSQSLIATSSWVETGTPFTERTGSEFRLDGAAPNASSATQPFNVPADQYYAIRFQVIISGASPDLSVFALISPAPDGEILDPESEYTFTADGSYFVTLHYHTLEAQEEIQAIINFSSGSANVQIIIDTTIPSYISVVKKSDCLDIKTEQPCTGVLEYSNSRDFAGIRYDAMSPTTVFSLRVPMVFFHDSYPEEQEVQELSDDTFVQKYAEITHKREMTLGYMPYYMHQKMKLVLMHDYVACDDTEWVKQDPYEIQDGNTRYPLKRAKVLLTDKNFIERNLI